MTRTHQRTKPAWLAAVWCATLLACSCELQPEPQPEAVEQADCSVDDADAAAGAGAGGGAGGAGITGVIAALQADGQVAVRPGPGDVNIVTPAEGAAHDFEALSKWCRSNRAQLRKAIFNKGGVLLRGWGVKDVRDAEDLLFQAIGFPQMELYPQTFIDFNLRARELGVPPGGLTQTKLSRNAPPAQDGVMQTPHIEFGLGPHRPRVVGFYVEVPPAVDGSTARVYFPEAITKMSLELRAALTDNGWWNPNALVVQPSVLVHPETKAETLQLYSFTTTLAPMAHEAYVQVRDTVRPDLPPVTDIPYNGDDSYAIVLVRPNGTKWTLPRAQVLEYFRAIFSTITLHFHEPRDIFLFDNVLYGHMRMPGAPPRKLHALFAEEIDSRSLRPGTAPACVHEGAALHAKGAVDVTLGQLGVGGNMFVLYMTNQLPDFLFKLLGRFAWVGGGGYATVKAE